MLDEQITGANLGEGSRGLIQSKLCPQIFKTIYKKYFEKSV